MVQIIPMERAPSLSQALGAGLGQGLSQGINYGIQDMLQQKQLARKAEYNRGINKQIGEALGIPQIGELLGGLEPKESIGLIKMLSEQGALQRGLQSKEKIFGIGSQPQEPQSVQNIDQSLFENIPYEHRPAIEEEPIVQRAPKQETFDQQKARFEELYRNETNPKVKAKMLEDWNKQRQFLQKEGEIGYKHHQDLIERNEKFSIPYLKNISDRARSAIGQDMALESAENAIRSGKTTGLVPSVFQALSEKFHWTVPWQNANTAILNASAKEFLLNNVTRAGSRPNMWLEQQVRSMFPQVGQSQEAALSVLEMIKNDNAISQQEARIAKDLEDKYKSEGLDYVPREIEHEVNKRLLPYIEERKSELASNLKKIEEEKYSDSDLDRMVAKKVMKGTPLTERMGLAILRASKGDTKKAMSIAKKLGYDIPGEE